MSGYTKGPWILDGVEIRASASHPMERICDMAPGFIAEDAKLIAAAPKLIGALQMLIDYADDSDGCQYGTLSTDLVRNIAQEAIDLATK